MLARSRPTAPLALLLGSLAGSACTDYTHRALGTLAEAAADDAGQPLHDGAGAVDGGKPCCEHRALLLDATVEACDELVCIAIFPPPNHRNPDQHASEGAPPGSNGR